MFKLKLKSLSAQTRKKPDFVLLILVILTALFGVLMVYNASVVEAFQLFSDKYYFLKLQSLWLVLGMVILGLTAFISLPFLKKIAPIALLINILLLIAVLIPGIGSTTYGARRWINIAGFTLQPTELIKLTLTLYLAAWLDKDKPLWPFLVILGVILGLIMLQPDLGTTIVIILTAVSIYFISGAPLMHLSLLGILGLLSGIGLIFLSPYRKERLLTFFNPARDPLGSSYHIQQALIAVGTGGLWGLGLGQSRQKYQFLPQVSTDSIFAIIAEELGFFGAGLVILILFAIVLRAFKIARFSPDNFTKLLSAGIASWLGLQILINISAMLALLPLTGVPLPFISYGGSSLLVTLAGIGLLLNISRFQISPKKKT